jgi:PadR family transcriptional regulator, regulatory protein PadR
MDEKTQETVKNLRQEMRRGITVAVVMQILGEAQYGYALLKNLNESGIEIGQDTLYPLLRRLEEQGLLDSEWRVEDPRPRRYYRLNRIGKEVYEALKDELKEIEKLIRRITNEPE